MNAQELGGEDGDRPVGTCVEGIRVLHQSPGFATADAIVAIANATGPHAPKTNVARSGLEATAERDRLLRNIYRAYASHIEAEMRELQSRRAYSMTWSAQEGRYLTQSLLNRHASSEELLRGAIFELPLVVIEEASVQRAVSVSDLRRAPALWTLDCLFFRSAEALIREVASSASLSALLEALKVDSLGMPKEPVVCDPTSLFALFEAVFHDKEVDVIRIDREQRRLDLRWVPVSTMTRHRWRRVLPKRSSGQDSQRTRLRELSRLMATRSIAGSTGDIHVATEQIEISGRDNEVGVRSHGQLFLFSDTRLAEFILEMAKHFEGDNENGDEAKTWLWFAVGQGLMSRGNKEPLSDLRRLMDSRIGRLISEDNLKEFSDILSQPMAVFDPAVWIRNVIQL